MHNISAGAPQSHLLSRHRLDRLEGIADCKRSRLLCGWILVEGIQEGADDIAHRVENPRVVDHPVPICVGRNSGKLVRVGAQVENVGHSQPAELALPDLQETRLVLDHEVDLPVVVAQRHHVTIVGEVEELLTRPFLFLTGQVWQKVVAIQVVLVSLTVGLIACEQLLLDVSVTRDGEQCRRPVEMRHDLVRDRTSLDLAGPAYELRHAVGALPAGVLLAAELRGAGIGPRVAVRAVVGGVDDDSVVGDAELIDQVEDLAHVLVMVDHRVVVVALCHAGLTEALGLGMSSEVHMGEIDPGKERLLGLYLALDEILRLGCNFVIDCFHPLLVQRTGILAFLLAHFAEARVFGRIINLRRHAIHDAARPVLLQEFGILRIVWQLRLLFGVQVVEVAKELVKAVKGRQILVAIAQMILAELARGVALLFEERGDRHVLGLKALRGARHPYLAEACADTCLAGDEGRASGRATLIGIHVGEHHAFLGEAVDIGRLVAHQPEVVGADIGFTDVVAPDDDDVGLVALRMSDTYYQRPGYECQEKKDCSWLLCIFHIHSFSAFIIDYTDLFPVKISSVYKYRVYVRYLARPCTLRYKSIIYN